MTEVVTQQQPQAKKERKPRTTYTAIRCMFKLTEAYLLIFREILKTIEDAFSDELPFEFDMDKLVLRVMDASRVKMVNVVLPKEVFEEWHVSGDGKHKLPELPVRVKLPIADVIYTIESVSKEAKATFEFTAIFATTKKKVRVDVRRPETCPKCGVLTNYNALPKEKQVKNRFKCVRCGWRGKVRKWQKSVRVAETEVMTDSKLTATVEDDTRDKHNLKILDENVEAIPTPIVHFNAKFKLVAKKFKEKLQKLAKKTDHFKIEGSRDGVILSGASDMMDSAITIERGSDILLDIDAPSKPESAVFSLDQITSIMPEKPNVAELVGVDYSTDSVMRLTWHTNIREATVEYYVAPRIETE
jgi:hypothetical protein